MREASQREKLSLHEGFESGLFIDENRRNINQLSAEDPKWGIRPFKEVKHLYPGKFVCSGWIIEGLLTRYRGSCGIEDAFEGAL